MIRLVSAIVCLVPLLLGTTACTHRDDPPTLKELQRAKSGTINVVLLAAADALPQGKGQAVLEFRSSTDARLVDVGAVKVNATMSMAGMPPMIGGTSVQRTDTAGRYALETDLSMAGSWRIGVEWDGPAGRGTATLPGTVR
jgi:hypothetical protein